MTLPRTLAAAVALCSALAFAQAPQPQAKPATPAAAPKPSKQLTLLITGDNRGEVAPCG